MGNQQSLEQAPRRSSLSPSQSRHDVSSLVVPLPDGGYSTTPEVRSQLRQEIFGNASDEAMREDAQQLAGYRPNRRISEGKVDVQRWAKILHIQDGQQIDIAGLAVMLQELKKTATGEELILLHQALLPSTTPGGYPTPLNPATPAREAETFEYRGDVIRRRSLFAPAPGTATRTSTQKLKKQPTKKVSPETKRQPSSTWSPEDFITSPLSRLAGMEPGKSALSTPFPRSATPTDLECTNLGTHMLGSLRITNASPDPSIRSAPSPQRSRFDLRPQEDYFNCVGGNGSISPGNMTTDDSKSTLSSVDMPATPPLHSQDHNNTNTKDFEDERIHSHFEPRANMTRQFSFTPDAAFSLYKTEASSNPYLPATGDNSQESSPGYHVNPRMQSNESLSKEVPPTPTDTASVYSSRSRPGSPRSFVEKSRNDAFSRLSGLKPAERPPPKLSPLPAYLDSANSRTPRYAPRNQPIQHDKAQRPSQHSSSPRARLPPPVPSTAWVQSSNGGPLPATPTEREESEQKVAAPAPSSGSGLSASTPTSSSSNLPQMTRSVTAEAVPASSPSSNVKPRKLQRKRAKSQQRDSIVVQTSKAVTNVPSVPISVASGYSQRMSSNPNMEHLEHTYESVSACEKRSLDLQPSSTSPVRFPSPSRDDARSSSRGRKALHRISRGNLKRRKSQDYGIDTADEIVNVADFGTVTESLGYSPYDAASPRPRRRSSNDMSSPHQITSRKERPSRSRHGMDEQAASEYAYRKSRDRLANMEDADSRLQSPSPHVDTDEPWPSEMPMDEDAPPMPSIPRRRPKSYQHASHGSPQSPATSGGSTPKRLSWPRAQPGSKLEPEAAKSNSNAMPSGVHDEDDAIDLMTKQNTTANSLPPQNIQPAQSDLTNVFEAQAQLWRQRRKSIGEGLDSSLVAPSEPRAVSEPPSEQRAMPIARPSTPHSKAISKAVESPATSGARVSSADIVTKVVRGERSAIGVLPGPFQGLPPRATEEPLKFRPLSKSPVRQPGAYSPFSASPYSLDPSKGDSAFVNSGLSTPTRSSASPTRLGRKPILRPTPSPSASTGSRSPSPTVKERAAMFDRVESSERAVELARIEAARRANLGVETKAGLLSGYCVNGR